MDRKWILYIFSLASLVLGGVFPAFAGEAPLEGAKPKPPVVEKPVLHTFQAGPILSKSSVQAADALQAVMATRVSKDSPVLVASMVPLNDYAHTSPLGRLVMQQVGSRLSQYGYRIIDSRLGRDYVMREHEGEFMLTRDTAKLLQSEYAAQAVLVGSYTETPRTVFCSLRLLRLDDGAVVSAFEYHLPNRGEVRRLLQSGSQEHSSIWAQYSHRKPAFAPEKEHASMTREKMGKGASKAKNFGVLGPPERIR